MSNFLNSRSMNNALLVKQRGFYHAKVERYKYGSFSLNEPNSVGYHHCYGLYSSAYFKHGNIDLSL